jgi:hypothetical protein
MRYLGILALAALIGGCAITGQIAARQAVESAGTCIKEIKSSPEGKIVGARIWQFDESDNAAKLTDPKALTKAEQDALVQNHNRLQRCRQIIIDHDNRYAAWETPYWQEAFQRGDAIFYKLASRELSVGLANKLLIESNGKFQTDVSKAHAEAVSVQEAQQQRASEMMLQAGAQIMASQPRTQVTTTNCSWIGNNLNCTGMRQ